MAPLKELVKQMCRSNHVPMHRFASVCNISHPRFSELISGARRPTRRDIKLVAKGLRIKQSKLADMMCAGRREWLDSEARYLDTILGEFK